MHLHNGSSKFSQFSFFMKHCNDFGIHNNMSHHLSNKRKIGIVFFRPPTSFSKGMMTYRHKSRADQSKPFSLILLRNTMSTCKSSGEKHVQKLGSEMILLKNYLDLSEQVAIVDKCEELGVGPGGVCHPSQNGSRVWFQMRCLGRKDERYRGDAAKPPPIPDKIFQIAMNALEVSQSHLNSKSELPLMSPHECIVNLFTTSSKLGLHQDRDKSSNSISVPLQWVSISIGDSVDCLCIDTRDVDNATKILLDSGDVLVYVGKSIDMFYAVKTIIPNSAPQPLLEQTMFRRGFQNFDLWFC